MQPRNSRLGVKGPRNSRSGILTKRKISTTKLAIGSKRTTKFAIGDPDEKENIDHEIRNWEQKDREILNRDWISSS